MLEQFGGQIEEQLKLKNSQKLSKFTKNQHIIIYAVNTCSNKEYVYHKLLAPLFQCQVTQIEKQTETPEYKQKQEYFKRKIWRIKCEIQNNKYIVYINQHHGFTFQEKIVMKNIMRTLMFKRNRDVNVKLTHLQLQCFMDQQLNKLFNLPLHYDWLIFLISMIVTYNFQCIPILSSLLQISQNKLQTISKKRMKAIKKCRNQDTNKCRDLKTYALSPQMRKFMITCQLEKSLLDMASAKYQGQSLQLTFRQTSYRNNKFLKRKDDTQKKIEKQKNGKYLQQILKEDQQSILKDKTSLLQSFKLPQKSEFSQEDTIYFSDDQIKNDQLIKCKKQQVFTKITPHSQIQSPNIIFYQQCLPQNKVSKCRAFLHGNNFPDLSNQEEYNQARKKRKYRKRNKNDKNNVNIESQKSEVCKFCIKKLQKTVYSYQDQAILYLLYLLYGIQGLKDLRAQRILRRKGQELVWYFINKNVISRAETLIQSFLDYPELLKFQKNHNLICLVVQLKKQIDKIQEPSKADQQQTQGYQTGDLIERLGKKFQNIDNQQFEQVNQDSWQLFLKQLKNENDEIKQEKVQTVQVKKQAQL